MTITKNNFKSPHIFLLYAIFLIIGIVLLVKYFLTKDIDLLYISLLLFGFLLALFTIGFLNKIQIDKNGITHKTLNENRLMYWKDIKTIGVLSINRFGVKIVKPNDYDRFSLTGQKFIFVSTDENFIPKQNQKSSSNFIQFHWRKEAWEEIKKYNQ